MEEIGDVRMRLTALAKPAFLSILDILQQMPYNPVVVETVAAAVTANLADTMEAKGDHTTAK